MITIENHAKVHQGTHPLGQVSAFVLDPRSMRLTHVVVRTHGLLPAAHLYRLDELSVTPDALTVTGLPVVGTDPLLADAATRDNEISFVPIGGWPHPQDSYDVGIVHVVGWQRTALGTTHRPRWTPDDLDMVVDFDKLPKGRVELEGASEVYDRDRRLLGHLRSVSIDETGALVGVRVRHWAFWAPHTFDVPAQDIKRILNGEVWLHTSHDDLARGGGVPREDLVAS